MPSRTRRAILLATALAVAAAQGCYAYLPAPAAAAPNPGERVRVALTTEGTVELARYLGPNVAVAEGELSSTDPAGTMVVAVDYVEQVNGVRQPWSGEGLVSIPANLRGEVKQRTFLRKQSIIAGAALTAGLIVTAIVALKAGGAAGGDGSGGGQPPPP